MDRRLLIASFNEYTKNYDVHEINISLKIAHTYRVADIAERVAAHEEEHSYEHTQRA